VRCEGPRPKPLLKKEGGILLAALKKDVQEVASLQPLGCVLVIERSSEGGRLGAGWLWPRGSCEILHNVIT